MADVSKVHFGKEKGRSNRARRAKKVCFNDCAGLTKIEGAAKNTHGNARGDEYDLGRNGAFNGCTVVVLQFYNESRFTFNEPKHALEMKGFKVDRYTYVPDPSTLRKLLKDDGTVQLWVISDGRKYLTKKHVEIIKNWHFNGGALYVWGDNVPFIVDANVLLEEMYSFRMDGNIPGGRVVHECPDGGQRGFVPHLITTGLEHLFEGITVATLDSVCHKFYGFQPLLYGSAKNLITAYREAEGRRGPIIIDGAFTRLYCQWDEAGSARYVKNAACWLAADNFADQEEVEEAELEIDLTNSFRGECDLTYNESNYLLLAVSEMPESDKNTSDFILTDPMSAGRYNMIFGGQIYSKNIADWVLKEGKDPYRQCPVVGLIPIVDFSQGQNKKIVENILCNVLMDGLRLPTAAWLIFFSAVDQMRNKSKQADHPEVWEYLYQQCLKHIKTTPDFTDVGKKIPLFDAMDKYMSPSTDELKRVNKSFSTVCLIIRTLLNGPSLAKKNPGTLINIVQQSYIKTLITNFLIYIKQKGQDNFTNMIHSLLYDVILDIPIEKTGHMVENIPLLDMKLIIEEFTRVENEIEIPEGTLTSTIGNINTVALYNLLTFNNNLTSYKAESLIIELLKNKIFQNMWNGKLPSSDETKEMVNSYLGGYYTYPDGDVHNDITVLFATPFGPSVYKCCCGLQFGDYNKPLTAEYAEQMKKKRNAHFRQIYASDENGYPTKRSIHYNLHRATQHILLKDKYKNEIDLSEKMVMDIAKYLIKDAKGNFHIPKIHDEIIKVANSYLELRKAGIKEPKEATGIDFLLKAKMERKMMLK